MNLSTTAIKVRAELANAGVTISASRCQDLLFDLYHFAGEATMPRLQLLLSLSLSRYTFLSSELEDLVVSIELESSLISQ